MNRVNFQEFQEFQGVPHVRGDEPLPYQRPAQLLRVPHVRGDEPGIDILSDRLQTCSPRPWG